MGNLETIDMSITSAKEAAKAVATTVVGENSYSFKQWRKYNSAVMIPDRGFRKQLKTLDSELEVAWNWGSEKWEIWRFPKDGGESHYVLSVETKDKSYRELGADVLLKLQAIAPGRWGVKELVAYFDELDTQNERRKAREFSNKMQAMGNEIWDFHWRPGGERPIRIQVPEQIKVRRVIADA